MQPLCSFRWYLFFYFPFDLSHIKKKKKAASNTFYKAENLKAPHCEKVNQPARGNGFQETPDLFQVGKSVWEMRKKLLILHESLDRPSANTRGGDKKPIFSGRLFTSTRPCAETP